MTSRCVRHPALHAALVWAAHCYAGHSASSCCKGSVIWLCTAFWSYAYMACGRCSSKFLLQAACRTAGPDNHDAAALLQGANILVSQNNTVKLADFGAAKDKLGQVTIGVPPQILLALPCLHAMSFIVLC